MNKLLEFKRKCKLKYGDPNVIYQLSYIDKKGNPRFIIVFLDVGDKNIDVYMFPHKDKDDRHGVTLRQHEAKELALSLLELNGIYT